MKTDKDIAHQKTNLSILRNLISKKDKFKGEQYAEYFKIKAKILSKHLHIRNKIQRGREILNNKKQARLKEIQNKREKEYPQLIRKREFESFKKEKFENLSKLPRLTKKLRKLNLKMSQEEISKLFSDVHQKIKREVEKNKTRIEKYEDLTEKKKQCHDRLKDLEMDIRDVPEIISEIKGEVRAKFQKSFGEFDYEKNSSDFESNFEYLKDRCRELLKGLNSFGTEAQCTPNFNFSDCLRQILEIEEFSHFKKQLKQNITNIIKIEISCDLRDTPRKDSLPQRPETRATLGVFVMKVNEVNTPLLLLQSMSGKIITSKLLGAIQIENQSAFESVFPRPENILEGLLATYCSFFSFRLLKNIESFLSKVSKTFFKKKKMVRDLDWLSESSQKNVFRRITYQDLVDLNWTLNFHLHQMIMNLLLKNKQKDILVSLKSTISKCDHLFLLSSSDFDILIIVFDNEFVGDKMLYVSASKVQKLLQLNLHKFEEDFMDCLVLPLSESLGSAGKKGKRFQNKACKLKETLLKVDLLKSFNEDKDNYVSIIRELF